MLSRLARVWATLGSLPDRTLLARAVRDAPEEARILRPLAYAGFALLATVLVATSCFIYSRFALTQDFAIYYHAVYEIAHGNLNPPDTVSGLPYFWQGHFELFFWIIAPIVALFPTALTLQLIQDVAGIAACIVAWRWIQTILYAGADVPNRRALSICALFVLVANPWIYHSYAFDVHSEPIAVALLLSSAYAFYLGRLWLGFGLALGCLPEGEVVATYLLGLGLTLLIVGGRRRRFGAALALMGVAIGWFQLTRAFGSGMGASINMDYGYIVFGVYPGPDPHFRQLSLASLALFCITHPLPVLKAFADKTIELYANMAPMGFIGVLSPWALGVSLIAILENELAFAVNFSQPLFQSIALYLFATVGLAWLLALVARRGWGRLAVAYAVIVCLDTAGWAWVWLPRVYADDVRTSAQAASSLREVARGVDTRDQVVATQGVIGRFAGRKEASALWYGNAAVPWRADTVQFVIVPWEGINIESVNRSLTSIDVLVRRYHALVQLHDSGVWWLTLAASEHPDRIDIPPYSADVPAWPCAGPAAYTDLFGPPEQWNAVIRGTPGYAVSRAYWRFGVGNYRAGVEIASTGPATLEVLDHTSNESIVRRTIPAGPKRRVYVALRHLDRGWAAGDLFQGYGPFVAERPEPPVHDNLEVRVYSPGVGEVRVYRIFMSRLPDGVVAAS